jgi:Cu2+-containing amine oxidase
MAGDHGKAIERSGSFRGGLEGGEDWEPKQFTTVVIEDEVVKNAAGRNISYELLGQYGGTARHYRSGEEYLRHDFWATRWHSSELAAENLPSYVTGERVENEDIVLWVMTAAHHSPRDEDFGFPGRTGEEVDPVVALRREIRFNVGSALVMWSGFMLRPRNFFDGTPLVPPIILPPFDPKEPDDPF